MKVFLIVLLAISISLASNFDLVSAEEFQVTIPFGAFNPELNTPAEVWYDPPTI